MASNTLTGNSISSTYLQGLHIGTGSASVTTIRTGDGTATVMELVSGGFKINGTFQSTGNATIGGNASVTGTLSVTGNVTMEGSLTVGSIAGLLVLTSQDSLSGAGAVSITSTTTLFTSTAGSQALTLADGANGQIKTIIHVVDGGSGILTPSTKTGYTTITFANLGAAATLMFITTRGWIIIASRDVTVA